MKQDEFDRAVARADRAFSKLNRIREGDEIGSDDALGVKRWRPGRASQVQRKDGQPQDRRIEFNRPVTRSYRLTNAGGATSFHFQHRAISKVTHEMDEGGLRNRPGAARAHSRYVEREVAVALIEPGLDADLASAVVAPAGSLDAHPSIDAATTVSTLSSTWRLIMNTTGPDTSGSIQGLPEDWWVTSPDLSPVLRNLLETASGKMPKPMPVCGCCPAGIWYVKGGEPMVTCPALKIYPWYPGQPFTDCEMRRRIFAAKAKSEPQDQ